MSTKALIMSVMLLVVSIAHSQTLSPSVVKEQSYTTSQKKSSHAPKVFKTLAKPSSQMPDAWQPQITSEGKSFLRQMAKRLSHSPRTKQPLDLSRLKQAHLMDGESLKLELQLREQSQDFEIIKDETSRLPIFIKGEQLWPANLDQANEEEKLQVVYSFLEAYRVLFQLNNPLSELKMRSIVTDKTGNTHI